MEEKINKKIRITNNIVIILAIIIVILLLLLIYIFYENVIDVTITKPIIYLYPEEETEVTVVAKYPEKFTHTYPKYNNSWKVTAQPDGTLLDKETGRELYALYWEGKSEINTNNEEGFCVKGEDTIIFLEDKLDKLGLTQREAEEFIVYWLPILEENKYNYIHFLTTEEVEEIMPLKITPEPDTRIRILMEYKALDKEIEIQEQEIITPEREGFVMVEWGGTELK